MARKPARAQTTKGKGYKSKGLTATKWKKSARPSEDAASRPGIQNRKSRGQSKTRTENEFPVAIMESKKLL